MRFSHEVAQFWGKDAIYISIVRDPVKMFESLFNYMKRIAPQFKEAQSLGTKYLYRKFEQLFENFLQKLAQLSSENFMKTPEDFSKLGASKPMTGFFAKNHMTFEFGLDPWESSEHVIRSEHISALADQWDFVLVNEHMAESLVILRRYLCMSLEDVACFITNQRSEKSSLPSRLQAQLKEWNKADWLLYRHFNQTLWRKIEAVGVELVNREVANLAKLVRRLADKCVEGYVENSQLEPEFRVYQPPGVKVKGIKVRKVIKPLLFA